MRREERGGEGEGKEKGRGSEGERKGGGRGKYATFSRQSHVVTSPLHTIYASNVN